MTAGNVSQRVVCSPPEPKCHQSNPRTTETGTMKGEITLTTHINTRSEPNPVHCLFL